MPRPGAAVDEQRVVRLRRRLRDRERRGVREAVRRADHEQVEGVLGVRLRAAHDATPAPAPARRRGLARRGLLLANGQRDADVASQRIPGRRLQETEEVTLDPFPGEVVRDDDRERVVTELATARCPEPGGVGRLVERLAESLGNVFPEARRALLGGLLHPRTAPSRSQGAASIAASRASLNVSATRPPPAKNSSILQVRFEALHRSLHTCGNAGCGRSRRAVARLVCSTFALAATDGACGKPGCKCPRLYWPLRGVLPPTAHRGESL